MTKDIDTKESIRIVTDNRFIVANGLDKLKLKERKLLYLAISQVRKTDEYFYEYRINPKEFAKLMNIKPSHVYQEADEMTDSLMRAFISCDLSEGKSKKARKYSLFNYIEYGNNSEIVFKLNADMAEFLLKLKKNFTQPLLNDFLKMNSPYSMAIWHLMQREMHSHKPGADVESNITFELSLDELRKVTGTTDKLKTIGNFKNRILDKAIREIKDNCSVIITYENILEGRTVTGFRFTVKQEVQYDVTKLDPGFVARVEAKAKELNRK